MRTYEPVTHACGEALARVTTARGVQYYPPPIGRALAVPLVECPRCKQALYERDMRRP